MHPAAVRHWTSSAELCLDVPVTDDFSESTIRRMRAIEENWDARTPVHLASDFYGIGSKDAEWWFAEFEWADLGDLTGRDVLHLQCHLGNETAAFAQRGARVVGVDLSGEAIRQARVIAEGSGLDIEFVHANVYDAAEALAGRRFDVIYTGKGALQYLPDLDRWATVLARLLKPGGLVYVIDFHPVHMSLGLLPVADTSKDLVLRFDYLPGRGPRELDEAHTYTDGPALSGPTVSYEWPHGLGELVTALAGAGLNITALREIDQLPWPRWSSMVPTDRSWWQMPDDMPRTPLMYAIRVVSP
jgi:2-polyprenyl-3-methyl-5-hydroxy-6-metoxy-1,4-benzoquinol methylase